VLDMSDKLGQHTRIELSQLKRNPKLDPSLFHFDPPPGVDVLSQ
jgi:outer membrane lipoprotein-sorting protein